MKDLTDKKLYDLERYEFDLALKRVIKKSEVSEKNKEIDEYLADKKMKSSAYSLDVSDFQSSQELQREQDFDSLSNRFNNIKQTEYESLVETIRKAIDPKRKRTKQSNSQSFGLNSNMANDYVDEVSQAMYWKEFYSWGKELSYLEDIDPIKKEENNRKSFGGFGGFNRNNNENKETQKEKDKRLIYENWTPLLEVAKVNIIFIIFNIIFLILKIKPFGANTLWLLIGMCLSFLFINYTLFKKYNDGFFAKNFALNTVNADLFLKDEFKVNVLPEQETEEQEEQNKKERTNKRRRPSPSRFGNSMFSDFDDDDDDKKEKSSTFNMFNDFNDDDFDDDDDDDFDLNDDFEGDEESDNKKSDLFNDFDDESDEDELDDDFDDEDDDKSDEDVIINDNDNKKNGKFNNKMKQIIEEQENNVFPQALGVASSEKDLFDLEEYFIKYTYANRKNIHFNSNRDIFNYFAPLIVNFNTKFGDYSQIDRDSWTFKNIAYSLIKYYCEIGSNFSKADEHDKDYYCVIDEILETDLYYKIRISIPLSIKEDSFKTNISKFNDILKNDKNDPCSVILEMTGREGYIKILKLNKKGFLPLVSTGDVLRFNGIKTTNGEDLYEELTKKGQDTPILFGLQNSEKAFVYDIGSNQNSNLAIVGFTGSGKSVSSCGWFNFVTVTHSPDDVGFIILDPKDGTTWAAFRYLPHVLGYFGKEDFAEWPNITNLLTSLCTQRQKYFKDLRTGKSNFNEARKLYSKIDYEKVMTVPRLIIIYDELLATMSSLKQIDDSNKVANQNRSKEDKKPINNLDSFKSAIGGLSNVTRESGITLVGLSQRSIDVAFPKNLLASCSMQFGMKMKVFGDGGKLFSCDDKNIPPDITSLPTGTGYFVGNNQERTQVQTPLFSGDPDLNDELTKTIGICWQIIYNQNEDISKIQEGFCLDKASISDIGEGTKFDNGTYLFNRDKFFEEVVKKDLLTGQVHNRFYDTDISIDLDKDRIKTIKPTTILDNKEIDDDKTNNVETSNVETSNVETSNVEINNVETNNIETNIYNSIKTTNKFDSKKESDLTYNSVEENYQQKTTSIFDDNNENDVFENEDIENEGIEDINVEDENQQEEKSMFDIEEEQVKKEPSMFDIEEEQREIQKQNNFIKKPSINLFNEEQIKEKPFLEIANYFIEKDKDIISVEELKQHFSIPLINAGINNHVFVLNIEKTVLKFLKNNL